MSQRRSLLLLMVLCTFAGPAFGQTIEFLDAQGNSLQDRYFEGSRAYLRVVDPAAATSVTAQVSAYMSGDVETVSLAETGAGTGVFEGSIELSIAAPAPDGRLQTSRDLAYSPPRFDILTAAYGAASDATSTMGATGEIVDAAGNPAETFLVGDRLYFRVVDVLANSTADVDTTFVRIDVDVRNSWDNENPTVTETGPDTSIFEGSIPTRLGISPVPGDGIVDLEPGDIAEARHYDANGQTYSYDEARALSSVPATIEWADSSYQPVAQAYEYSFLTLRATDGDRAGTGSLTARITSDLRGDEEWIYLSEDSYNPGVFYGWVNINATPATSPPATTDGWFQVTEIPGPPLQRDTIHAFLEGCAAPPCPTDAVPVIGSTTRLTDDQRADVELVAPGSPVFIEVVDWSVFYYPSITTGIASQSGDFEIVTLQRLDAPDYGVFRGSVQVESGPAVQGDGVLQVQEPDTITASHPDPMGYSSSSDTVAVGAAQIQFLDRAGNPVDFVLANGDVRVRAVYPAGNANPSAADTVTVTVRSRQFDGSVRDTEPLQLFETGPNTAVFTGEMPSLVHYWTVPGDGVLQVWQTNQQNDTVEVALESATATATLTAAILRIVDASGADVTNLPESGPLYLHVESDYANYPTFQDIIYVSALSLTTGDSETFSLQETGLDTSIFTGSLPISIAASPAYGNGQLEVQLGETIRASFGTYFGILVDLAVVGDGDPTGNPPNAVDDAATTPDDLPVSINVLANDSGLSLWVMSFTQGAQGGTVTDNGGGVLTYAPPPYFTGTDTFTYRVRDQIGDEDMATVTVTVQFVNDPPSANADAFSTYEDQPAAITPTDNDHDPENQALRIIAVTQGSKGAVAIANADLGYVSYTPQPNANGGDAFTYTIQDPQGATATATVNVTIQPLQDPPVAVNDAATTAEDTLVSIYVRDNDSDPDGDTVWISNVTQGAHGAVGADSTYLNYQPAANYYGTDSFTYTINDGNGNYATATVTVTITPTPDAPIAVTDNVSINEDSPTALAVLANDSDPDGDPISLTAVTQGFHGSVTINANGTVTYTPEANYHDTDWFNYTIRDSTGRSATARVNVTVLNVNDPPVAVNDSVTTKEDTPTPVYVTANDSDPDGESLIVSSFTQGGHGTVTLNSGLLQYAPAANYNGTDTFTYTVRDFAGATGTATVTVTITPVWDAPNAVNDAATTAEDSAVTVAVLANDSDVDGDTLSVTAVTQGAHGSVTFNATSVTYTPAANFNGADAFTYTVTDGTGIFATQTVSITVIPVNDPPVAANDSKTTVEDTATTIGVLANDSDPDGDALAVTTVTQGTRGTVTFTASSVTYTPNANVNGADSFTYTISDGNGGTATATVAISVTAVNDSPIAANDSATTNEDSAVTVGVLANDSDPEGDTLSITAVTQGSNGSVTFTAGSVTYTPAANFNGADSFTYTISDGNGGSATATVSITVNAVNDSPVAANDSKTTAEDTATTISVLANDSDPDGDTLSITAVTQGSNGSVTFNATSVSYTPNANFNGTDSFTYTISDGNGGTATATVSITVNAVNDSPVAGNDAASTNEDTAVAINVLTNDSDLDGDALAVSAVTQGTKGSVTFAAGSVTYTPAANANGTDSFTYTVSDGNGGTATATVAITINAVNDAPDAVNDSAATNEDVAVTISVLANDADVDSEAVILTGVTQGTRGSVVQNGNGTVTYTPNPNTFGADAFTYSIRDAAGLTDTATVAVNVAPVNDPPDAINDSATANEGSNVVITVLANDTDLEGNALTVTAASTPAHGTVTINGNGTITYTPAPTYSGPDSFTYTISDGAATDSATVSVQVKDVIGNVAVLGAHSVWLQSGADVLSGDVVANEAGSAPFLGSTEVSIGGSGASTAAGWDVQGNRVTVASGASVASDVYYNQLTNNGSIGGAQYTPLSLPVFAALPAFQSASPGSTDVNVANNGSQTLAPGSYRDLIVGRKATVTFTGGTYHFRSILIDREAKLFFSSASGIRVQQKMSTGVLVTIGPGSGSSATAASIVFYVGGINGTTGTLAATPKAVEVGSNNVVSANIYAPNGTLWLKDQAQATGSFLGRDVNIGVNVQVSLMSAW